MKYNAQKQIITATATSNIGLGFFSLLELVFTVLKLCGIIHWSWIWVFMPTLLPIGILSLVLLFLVFRYIIPGYLKEATNKKKK